MTVEVVRKSEQPSQISVELLHIKFSISYFCNKIDGHSFENPFLYLYLNGR